MSGMRRVVQEMKLCLSSISTHFDRFSLALLENCKFALESFYYSKPNMMDYFTARAFFIMDSGAFTFRESVKRPMKYEDYVDYTLKYADCIKRYRITHFFEMDVDSLIGLSKVEQLRAILEERTGRKSIPVWHIERGKQYFIDMCKEYPYVSVGGIAGGTRQQYAEYQKYFPWFIKTAHEHGAKIHGLGFTPGNLDQYQFDSVDSSTWTSGGRYGSLQRFDGQRIRTVHPEGRRARAYQQIDGHNFLEWCAYQRYMERI